MAGDLGRGRGLRGRRRPVQIEILPARDVSLSLRPHPHGTRPQLFHRRRHRPLQGDEGLQRHPPHRLGRAGHAGRERGHQARHPSPEVDPGQHRLHARTAQEDGPRLRLVPRGQLLPARLLQVEPVDLPEDVRARPGLPQGQLGQLVPPVPDRPGQRTGRRRGLLAVRHAGRRRRRWSSGSSRSPTTPRSFSPATRLSASGPSTSS